MSCISLCFGAENIPDIEVTSTPEPILGQFQIQGGKPNGDIITVHSTIEYLPALGRTGAGYQILSYVNPEFSLLNYSENGFNGYYSIYIGLVFLSTGSQADISASELNKLTNLRFQIGSETIIPKINISATYNSDWLPVNSSYYYLKTVWLKYDFHFEAQSNNHTYQINSFTSPAVSISLTDTQSSYFICELINFSVVKYEDQAQYDNSDNLDSIAHNIASINTNLAENIPQIVDYLNSIDINISDIENYLENDLDDFLSDICTYLNHIDVNTDSIEYQLTSNTRTTIYWMLYQLTISLSNQGSNVTNTPYYYLFRIPKNTYNYFDYTYGNDLDTFDIYDNDSNGLIGAIFTFLESINSILIWNFSDKQNTLNSIGYQTGDSIASDINSASGYSGLSDVGSNLSGIGNMALIPSIFNGIGSAFRWFTTQTRDNLDMVPQNRGEQETISHYYYENQASAESILAGD